MFDLLAATSVSEIKTFSNVDPKVQNSELNKNISNVNNGTNYEVSWFSQNQPTKSNTSETKFGANENKFEVESDQRSPDISTDANKFVDLLLQNNESEPNADSTSAVIASSTKSTDSIRSPDTIKYNIDVLNLDATDANLEKSRSSVAVSKLSSSTYAEKNLETFNNLVEKVNTSDQYELEPSSDANAFCDLFQNKVNNESAVSNAELYVSSAMHELIQYSDSTDSSESDEIYYKQDPDIEVKCGKNDALVQELDQPSLVSEDSSGAIKKTVLTIDQTEPKVLTDLKAFDDKFHHDKTDNQTADSTSDFTISNAEVLALSNLNQYSDSLGSSTSSEAYLELSKPSIETALQKPFPVPLNLKPCNDNNVKKNSRYKTEAEKQLLSEISKNERSDSSTKIDSSSYTRPFCASIKGNIHEDTSTINNNVVCKDTNVISSKHLAKQNSSKTVTVTTVKEKISASEPMNINTYSEKNKTSTTLETSLATNRSHLHIHDLQLDNHATIKKLASEEDALYYGANVTNSGATNNEANSNMEELEDGEILSDEDNWKSSKLLYLFVYKSLSCISHTLKFS